MEVDEGYRFLNIGAGIAVEVSLPSIHLKDAKGNRLTCEFDVIHMLLHAGVADLNMIVQSYPVGETL